MDQTVRQTNRLARLVDDLLDISRIQAGKLALVPERVDLCELAVYAVEQLKERFESEGKVPPRVTACDRAFGNWDRMRIEQVVINLLTNALRYGQGKPISVRVSVEQGYARLQVEDRGIGISKQAQKIIFNQFERAIDSNEGSGLGLGLFISRQIVEAHGGRIQVDSEPGEGATFEVYLPLERSPQDV